jgi:DNA mismatch endonuclease (patch repair protein)
MDIVDAERRSRMMAGIGPRHTQPELRVRRVAHRLGLRFRLHKKELPGCPDLVFSRFRTVVFVHGCFWHRHSGCRKCYTPKTRVPFWSSKFAGNVARDARDTALLRGAGWRVITIWECETENPRTIQRRLNVLVRRKRLAGAEEERSRTQTSAKRGLGK